MHNKLDLDRELVSKARLKAQNIANEMQEFINGYTTTTIERTICRLLGIDGVNKKGIPLPNVIVDNIDVKKGAAAYLGSIIHKTGLEPQEIAEKVGNGSINLRNISLVESKDIQNAILPLAELGAARIRTNREERETYLKTHGDKEGPLLYVIVATGNIYEDIIQADSAARKGADIIAVIRSTGQSLMDYVPYGATTQGFGGTYATQENFRLMRKALDEAGNDLGRYIRLCNYCSGLCMPEIAAMGALERLDVMLNDALYGILFRDINMQRTIIDQHFSRMINGYSGVIINTGEDNYIKTVDAVDQAFTVLTSQLMNEQFAILAGIPEEQMGIGHAFEMNPTVKNGFLYELAQAQLSREVFPNAPLKYMPPTRYMTGDVFMGCVQNALFNIVTKITDQKICLLGMLTEAIHTPFMSDRSIAIDIAQYIFNNMENISDEILFKPDGIINRQANTSLKKAYDLLSKIEQQGLFKTLEVGTFAGIRRPIDGGKGLDGVVKKGELYFNPFIGIFLKAKEGV
ncbi:MAG: D-lysine 5,6-aminomutase subunit alpha [Promethearchaeota archaeon]|nr:MAG: D-lysine 5,6-aminomutase subunit alpha [Candidatus Lokiarchaeota archaeon]